MDFDDDDDDDGDALQEVLLASLVSFENGNDNVINEGHHNSNSGTTNIISKNILDLIFVTVGI